MSFLSKLFKKDRQIAKIDPDIFIYTPEEAALDARIINREDQEQIGRACKIIQKTAKERKEVTIDFWAKHGWNQATMDYLKSIGYTVKRIEYSTVRWEVSFNRLPDINIE